MGGNRLLAINEDPIGVLDAAVALGSADLGRDVRRHEQQRLDLPRQQPHAELPPLHVLCRPRGQRAELDAVPAEDSALRLGLRQRDSRRQAHRDHLHNTGGLQLLRHRRRFRRLAMTDPLTGLGNRRATLEKMDQALRNVGPTQPRASFVLLDIDHFKWWNDTFDHDAGDRILNDFARVVERSVRPTDIVGRWGGEEFLVVLPATGLEEARQIIERVRTEAAQEVFDFAPGYRVRFSAGIAMPGETGGLTDACIRLADRRLYAAKAKGRNRTCIEGKRCPSKTLRKRAPGKFPRRARPLPRPPDP